MSLRSRPAFLSPSASASRPWVAAQWGPWFGWSMNPSATSPARRVSPFWVAAIQIGIVSRTGGAKAPANVRQSWWWNFPSKVWRPPGMWLLANTSRMTWIDSRSWATGVAE